MAPKTCREPFGLFPISEGNVQVARFGFGLGVEDKKCKYHCLRHSPGRSGGLMGGGLGVFASQKANPESWKKRLTTTLALFSLPASKSPRVRDWENTFRFVFCIPLWFLTSLQKVSPAAPRGMNTLSPTYCIRRQQFQESQPCLCLHVHYIHTYIYILLYCCVREWKALFPLSGLHFPGFPYTLCCWCLFSARRRIRKTF